MPDEDSKRSINLKPLQTLMEAFVKGDDRTLKTAGEIEVALDALMGDEEPFASLVLALASYRPEGGPYLYAEADLVPMMETALDRLRSRAADSPGTPPPHHGTPPHGHVNDPGGRQRGSDNQVDRLDPPKKQ